MEAPLSRQMTGGYIAKPNLAALQPQKGNPFCILPRDPLVMIFYHAIISKKDRGRFAQVCKCFNAFLKSGEDYLRSEFMFRFEILKCYIKIHEDNEQAKDLLVRAMTFLADPKHKFSDMEIPGSHIDSTISKISHALTRSQKKSKNQLLCEIQELLEEKYPQGFPFYDSEDLPINTKPDNEYEMQAVYNCLFPVMKKSFEKNDRRLPLGKQGAKYISFTLPVFNPMIDALFSVSKKKIHLIDVSIDGATCPDHLSKLNRALAHAENLEKIIFSTSHMDPAKPFSWNAGSGLTAIKEGLVRAPKLKIFALNELNEPLDNNNALALADIVISRQKSKKVKPFEEIHLGDRTIKEEATWVLLDALKNYPVPLVIFFTIAGNFPSMQQPFTRNFDGLGKQLNLRYETGYSSYEFRSYSAPMYYDPETNSMSWSGLWLKRLEKIEAARNSGK